MIYLNYSGQLKPPIENLCILVAFRKVQPTYNGFCIEVERSSDNARQNIGFDGSGELDTVSLLAFVGANDGYITRWYNQEVSSGVGDLIWNDVGQMDIVQSGVLLILNGKPYCTADGSGAFLGTEVVPNGKPYTSVLVGKLQSFSTHVFSVGSTGYLHHRNQNTALRYRNNGLTVDFAGTIDSVNQSICVHGHDAVNQGTVFYNGIDLGTQTIGSDWVVHLDIGGGSSKQYQELRWYDVDNNGLLGAISDELNDYYGTY